MHPGNTAPGPHFQVVAKVVCSSRDNWLGAKKKKALASLAKGAVPLYPSRRAEQLHGQTKTTSQQGKVRIIGLQSQEQAYLQCSSSQNQDPGPKLRCSKEEKPQNVCFSQFVVFREDWCKSSMLLSVRAHLEHKQLYSRSASILCSWCDYTPDSPSDLISPQFLVLEQVKSTVFRRDQTVNASERNP